MRLTRYIFLSLPLLLLASCSKCADQALDPSARLLQQLEQRVADGVMLGHQDDLAYGCMWYDLPERSDMNYASGHYPAVFGWDIGNIETGATLNPDSVKFDKIKDYIVKADSMGAVSTIRWSAAPVAADGSTSLASILPGGPCHDRYNRYLDKVASFLHSLRDAQGEPIAVIFQPLYCPNEDCHWWCTADDSDIDAYKQAWAYTARYLRDTAHVDNALFAFSLASPLSTELWSRYYPGDDCVDIIGTDIVADTSDSIDSFSADLHSSLASLTAFADAHHKLPALTATGIMGIKTPAFFTKHLAGELADSHLSYVMLWKNSWKDEDSYYMPFKGHPVADDFKNFVESDNILTCSDLHGSDHKI